MVCLQEILQYILFVCIHTNFRTEVPQQYVGQCPIAGNSAQWRSLFPVINDLQNTSPEKKASSPALAKLYLPTLMAPYQMLKHEIIIVYLPQTGHLLTHKEKTRVIVTPGDTHCFAHTHMSLFPDVAGFAEHSQPVLSDQR